MVEPTKSEAQPSPISAILSGKNPAGIMILLLGLMGFNIATIQGISSAPAKIDAMASLLDEISDDTQELKDRLVKLELRSEGIVALREKFEKHECDATKRSERIIELEHEVRDLKRRIEILEAN